MRISIGLVLLASGCLGSGGSVTLTVSNASGVMPTVGNYSASNGTATTDSTGMVHLSAIDGAGDQLTSNLQGPLSVGQMLSLVADHNDLSYDAPGAGWSSNGGMVAVDGVSPFKLRFISVPMIVGSGSAKGTFTFDGSGTF